MWENPAVPKMHQSGLIGAMARPDAAGSFDLDPIPGDDCKLVRGNDFRAASRDACDGRYAFGDGNEGLIGQSGNGNSTPMDDHNDVRRIDRHRPTRLTVNNGLDRKRA